MFRSVVGSQKHRLPFGEINLPLVLMACLLAVVSFLVLYPLGWVLFSSVWDATPGQPGNFTMEGYTKVTGALSTYQVLWTSFWLALARTILAVTIAISLAWLIQRTDMPLRHLLDAAIYFTFFLPTLPMVMAWVFLLSPRSGLLNLFFTNILGFSTGPFNIYSYWGIIWVGTLNIVSFLYIFLAPAFRAMDASLEESSQLSGAGRAATLFRITLPLLAPAILATFILGFVRMIESFEVELFLGTPAKIYVFTTKIYDFIYGYPKPQYTPAMALAALLLMVTFVTVIIQWRLLGSKEYTTVTGRGYRPRPIELGPWKYLALGAVLFFLFVDLLLPFITLIHASFMKVSGVFMPDTYTLDHYRAALKGGLMSQMLGNTAVMAFSSATVGMALCGLIAYVVVKTKLVGRKALDLIVWVPWGVPALVMATGFFWAFIYLPLPFSLYGTLWLMVLAFVARGFPLGTRTITSSMVQVSSELEESSRVHGASWLQTSLRIWLPLLKPAFIGGWIILFTMAARNLDTVVLFYGPESRVLATEIFKHWNIGSTEVAAILGLVQVGLISVSFAGAKLIAR